MCVRKLIAIVLVLLTREALGQVKVAFVAEYEVMHEQKLTDGNVLERVQKGMYYRDSQGRTRLEMGRLATISDPVMGTYVVLDTESKVAQKVTREKLSLMSERAKETKMIRIESDVLLGGKRGSVVKPLGTRTVEGLVCEGKELITTIPPIRFLGISVPSRSRPRYGSP